MNSAVINEIFYTVNSSYEKQRSSEIFVAKAKNFIKEFTEQHQIAIGFAEIALGVSVIGTGIAAGGLLDSQTLIPQVLSLGTGGALGAKGGSTIGGIGIAVLGTAFGIPAIAVTIGGTVLGGLAGFYTGVSLSQMLHPASTLFVDVSTMSLLTVGSYLIYAGVRNIITSDLCHDIISYVKETIFTAYNDLSMDTK